MLLREREHRFGLVVGVLTQRSSARLLDEERSLGHALLDMGKDARGVCEILPGLELMQQGSTPYSHRVQNDPCIHDIRVIAAALCATQSEDIDVVPPCTLSNESGVRVSCLG